ncbi:antitoxin family protein [Thermococcus sp.]
MEEVRAVYHKGVLVPLKSLNLREGEEVTVIIKKKAPRRYFGMFKREDVEKVIEEIENEGVLWQ